MQRNSTLPAPVPEEVKDPSPKMKSKETEEIKTTDQVTKEFDERMKAITEKHFKERERDLLLIRVNKMLAETGK